ncbi:MAG TPA: histidine--tRNA ligase [Candidatus Kapabacteria bacterium]|nr:histidine--tRNA ligase [Candidatus Kapabacteria bacterium]
MLQNVRGTKDIFLNDIEKWHYVENKIKEVCSLFAYTELRTPIFEKTEVFSRSIGDTTDIVNKEMYTFVDKGGESITLRPEMTAALVRSVIQNNLTHDVSTLRLYYFGPFFRYERPQKGRLRQFHQFGAECIASPYPESDVEIIQLAYKLIQQLGIDNFVLEINSLGNEQSRANYKAALVDYLQQNINHLSLDSQSRLLTNPLRVLDSKDEKDKLITLNAPNILEYLDKESKEHFDAVVELLESANVPFVISPKLVRGLDYYCHTVFEFKSTALGSQDAFGGGGRYNTLFEQLGGKSTPAVGFAMGIERLILILEHLGKFEHQTKNYDIYIVHSGDNTTQYANQVASSLRNRGKKVVLDLQKRSFKAQMREADKFGASYSIIIGANELNDNKLTIKNLKDGGQAEISFKLINTINFD